MSTAPIRIPIGVTDEYSAGFAAAQARVREFGAASGMAGEKMTRSFSESRASVALLNEELGTGLSRHLRTVLATSELIGPALNAAFPLVAAVAFFEVVERIGKKLADWYYDSEALKQFDEAVKSTTADLVKLAAEVAHLNAQTAGVGVSAQQKWATALDEATKNLAAENESARRLSDTIYALKNNQNAFGSSGSILSNTAKDIPDLELFYGKTVANVAKFYAEVQHDQAELNLAQRAGMDEYNKKLDEAGKKAEAARDAWNKAMQAATASTDSLLGKDDSFTKQLAAIDEQLQKWSLIAAQQQGIHTRAGEYLAQLNQQRDAVLQQRQAWDAVLQDATKFASFLPAQKFGGFAGDDKAIQRQKDIYGWYQATRTAAERYATEVKRLNELFADDKSSDTYKRSLDQINQTYGELHHNVAEFGRAAGDALRQGLVLSESWKKVFESLMVTVADLIIRMTLLKKLEESFGVGGSKGGWGGFFTAFVGAFTGGHAAGGYMPPGTWGIAGEHGPEPIFAGPTGMTIMPNRSMGGNTYNYVIHAEGAEMGVERKIMAAMQITEQRSVARAVAITRENALRGRG